MKTRSFYQIGEDIISIVQLAVERKWSKAEEVQVRVSLLLGERHGKPGKELQTWSQFHKRRRCHQLCGNILASVYTVKGRWQQAETFLKDLLHLAHSRLPEGKIDVLNKALEIEEKQQTAEVIYQQTSNHKNNKRTLTIKNNLVTAFVKQGKLQEAEKMHKEDLDKRRRVLGEDHPDTLSSMNKLAGVLQKQGKWQQAEKRHREVCDMTIKNNLATVFQEQGKWQEAEKMYREVVEKRRQVAGEDHKDTLSSMNKLASVLSKQGKWQQAEKMHREVLDKRRRVLGEDHQHTLSSMNNLANFLKEQGKWQEAEKMHREVLDKRRRVLGEEHQHTLGSMNNLAVLLQEQREWQEAEEMHRQILQARRQVLGEEHEYTLSSMNNLAIVFQEQGKWQEAEKIHREVLEKRQRILGEEHQRALNSMNNLANVLQEQGKWQEAEKMHREVLDKRRRVLGEAHQETLGSMNNLAKVLREQGKWQEAEKMHRVVLESMRRVLGEDQQDTLKSMSSLAVVFQEQGKWQEAEKMHKEVLDKRRRVLGEDHPDTLASMHNFRSCVSSRDRDDGQFRQSVHQEQSVSVEDSIAKVREAADSLQHRVPGDHPDLLKQRVVLAKLLIQTKEPSRLPEAEELLQLVVPVFRKRYGLEHPRSQDAIKNLVFVLEELGKDADGWKQYLLPVQGDPDSTTAPSTGDELEESLSGEKLEGLDEALRVLRGSKEQMRHDASVASSNKSCASGQVPHQEASQDALPASSFGPGSLASSQSAVLTSCAQSLESGPASSSSFIANALPARQEKEESDEIEMRSGQFEG